MKFLLFVFYDLSQVFENPDYVKSTIPYALRAANTRLKLSNWKDESEMIK